MHSVRHEFSSVIEKPRERTLDQILNIHSRFEVLGGSVTNVVGKYWLRSKDGTAEEVGTNDKMILFNRIGFNLVIKHPKFFKRSYIVYV